MSGWFGGPYPQPRLELKCPSCKLVVIRDDAAHAILHEAPECKWFSGMMAKVPQGQRIAQVEGAKVDEHLASLAEDIKRRGS